MLGLTTETRVFLKTGATDLRLAFEGLRALVVNVIRQDPTSGCVFAFCNKARNRVRCLYWDGSGLWLSTKRIESGTVDWPKDEAGAAEMNGVQLLDPDRRHKAQDAWLWTYLGPKADTIVFQFSLTRGAENPQAFFPSNWRGELQSDGYGVYTSLARSRPGIMLFGCWTHARSRAAEALKSGELKALPLLQTINELYAIETEAKKRGYTHQQRAYYRYAKCRPIFRRLKAHFEELKSTELPSSHLGDAAKYALNRWPQLVRYANPNYGHINIDQNPVESNIRPTKIGAKNWMHIGHPKAGWRSAVIYSIVGTCRLLKVDPLAYLTWVLPRLAAATNQTATGLLLHDYARLHPRPNTS